MLFSREACSRRCMQVYNPKIGMDSLVVAPISQASAKQRAGARRAHRAGQVLPAVHRGRLQVRDAAAVRARDPAHQPGCALALLRPAGGTCFRPSSWCKIPAELKIRLSPAGAQSHHGLKPCACLIMGVDWLRSGCCHLECH